MTTWHIQIPGRGDIRLRPGETLVAGRDPACGVVLDDGRVSRRHVQLAVADTGDLTVADLQSRYGTFVNGVRSDQPARVSERAIVQVGSIQLVCLPAAGAPARGRGGPEPAAPARAMPAEAGEEMPMDAARDQKLLYSPEIMALKKEVQERILDRLNLREIAIQQTHDESTRAKLEAALDQILVEVAHRIPPELREENRFRTALVDELLEFGPITPLLRDAAVTEVMVNGPERVFVEKRGKLFQTTVRFYNENHLRLIIARIVEPLGRHVDESSPMVDARLGKGMVAEGSRVNAIVPPLALEGSSLTIRKFAVKKLTTQDLIGYGSLTLGMAQFLEEAVRSRLNILVSGGTGSGKTTLLNILSLFIPQNERVVTIEDSAELKLNHPNLVRLESRPKNIEGKGEISIRQLVINSLRMRPDRIIVGECRGGEAFDMLQAMNTGHDGSLTTIHANTPRDSLTRLENLVMMAVELPPKAIRAQVATAVNLVVQQSRMVDGTRKVVAVTEITGMEGDVISAQDIFQFKQTGFGPKAEVQGYFTATGNIPHFVEKLRQKGDLRLDPAIFTPAHGPQAG